MCGDGREESMSSFGADEVPPIPCVHVCTHSATHTHTATQPHTDIHTRT